MGCRVENDFQYQERLVCHGRAVTVDYAKRNRTIVKAWTCDRELTLIWSADQITFHGPKGSEVMVEFKIGRL